MGRKKRRWAKSLILIKESFGVMKYSCREMKAYEPLFNSSRYSAMAK